MSSSSPVNPASSLPGCGCGWSQYFYHSAAWTNFPFFNSPLTYASVVCDHPPSSSARLGASGHLTPLHYLGHPVPPSTLSALPWYTTIEDNYRPSGPTSCCTTMQGRFSSPTTTWCDEPDDMEPSIAPIFLWSSPFSSAFHSHKEEILFNPICPTARALTDCSVFSEATAQHIFTTVCGWYPVGHAIASDVASWISKEFLSITCTLHQPVVASTDDTTNNPDSRAMFPCLSPVISTSLSTSAAHFDLPCSSPTGLRPTVRHSSGLFPDPWYPSSNYIWSWFTPLHCLTLELASLSELQTHDKCQFQLDGRNLPIPLYLQVEALHDKLCHLVCNLHVPRSAHPIDCHIHRLSFAPSGSGASSILNPRLCWMLWLLDWVKSLWFLISAIQRGKAPHPVCLHGAPSGMIPLCATFVLAPTIWPRIVGY